MHKLIIPMTALALCACQKTEVAGNDAAANAVVASDVATANNAMADAAAPSAAGASLMRTTYEFTDAKSGKAMQQSIDESGGFIIEAGSEHIDHGTAAMKDGKACFTSAMTKDGEICWTDPKLAVGQSGETISDKGEKLAIKRVEYVAKSM